ncbi:Os07g0667900, partial [Oryza sativa Japonica Group]
MVRVEERRETKVPDLQHAIVVQKQVRPLDVAVQHPPVVAVLQSRQQLVHIALDLRPQTPLEGELDLGAGGEAGEVVDHVVEDEVEAAGHAGGDEAVELDDIGVVEAAEDEDLPGHEAHALGLQVVEAHLLERHDLAAHRVPRLVHVAVREEAHLVDLLEGVGAARGPAVDGVAGDGGEPGGPARGHLLAARLVREAPPDAHLGVRVRVRRPRRPRA